jgi:hypothetical protein
MFEIFSTNFQCDDDTFFEPLGANKVDNITEHVELLLRFEGKSFCKGAYRIIRVTDLVEWKRRVSLAFPQFESRISCFGYDWLGTVFATDSGRLVDGRPGVIMFEPGTGKALNVPCNIESFHETGLVEFGEATLVDRI